MALYTNLIEPPSPPKAITEIAKIPDGAINLYRQKVGPQLFFVPSRECILKVGSISLSEAEAMRFIAKHTTVPVPYVHEAYEEDGLGYIYMSKVEGKLLAKVWRELSDEKRAVVSRQLKEYVEQWQGLRGQFYGSLGPGPCEDIFFQHLCLLPPYELKYGPYFSREEYNNGLVKALINSRPRGEPQLGASERTLIQKLSSLKDETKIFSHGDLHPGNVFVDDSCNITGIIDWGMAGFSVKERDYVEAKLRARNQEWAKELEVIFGDHVKGNSECFLELNKALVEYSGL